VNDFPIFDENGRNRFPIAMPAICVCGHNANYHAVDLDNRDDNHCSQCECKRFDPADDKTQKEYGSKMASESEKRLFGHG
jgi:hypothetical protein